MKLLGCRGIVILARCVIVGGHSFVIAQDNSSIDSSSMVELFSPGSAQDMSYIDAWVTKPKDSGSGLITRRVEIIKTFCDSVLQVRDDTNIARTWFDYQDYRYDPKQSMFVYSLCVGAESRRGTSEYAPAFEAVGQGYPEQTTYVMADQRLSDPNHELITARGLPNTQILDTPANQGVYTCDPRSTMQSCDFSTRLPQLYRTIMNEVVTMRQAAVYGVASDTLTATDDQTKKEQIQLSVEKFSYKYFMAGEDGGVTCGDDGLHYLSKEGGEGPSAHCVHPRANTLLAQIIKQQTNALEKLRYLNAASIFHQGCETPSDRRANLYSCAMSSYRVRPGVSDAQSFHNILLNELMRYQMFVTYYLNTISTNTQLNSQNGIVNALNAVSDEVGVLTYEQRLATQAVQMTLRMLDGIQSSFPIHIALQAYLEDVKNYKKQITKVHTPMHQLYYLLRNVQECQ